MPSKPPAESILNFDVDTYLNPIIPPSQLHRIPKTISHFLGHRNHQPSEPPHLISYTLAYLATVTGLCLVGGVYNHAPGPRNIILGHTLSAIVAVGVSKGFQHYTLFPRIDWLAAAIVCATANLVMSLTNTIHPPGSATAILACIQTDVVAMGWTYVPLVLIASVLLCSVACLFNNMLRWYPTHWRASAQVGQAYASVRREREVREKEQVGASADLEKQKMGAGRRRRVR
ncbi:hypothetical protein KC317_g2312 [Hortaea werneckii]|nr:hypothetical protein KC352_g7212 [Hortaea werneckii]KAI7291161.1 hypothetical protein KC340_g17169 [Hortaea werneckii]KAI7375731.1 hypothetical protein KC328_g15262 [Hortaea werneckii]KAI7570610.1 hypothetical protein KC317_g2312 [Hortaea werneckii]KAI7628355.1 hypothetical protein KC346_g222 [Hortaea werneckii]